MMRARLHQIKMHIRQALRSLMVRLRRGRKRAVVTDLDLTAVPRAVMLRERVFRIEISRKSAIRFFSERKKVTAGFLGLFVLAFFFRYFLVGFASTENLYPSSCLGSWENVARALGKPELPSDASQSSFNGLNSAFFGTSTAQMFCGNFAGETDFGTLEKKSLENATLVLSWTFIFPDQSAASGSSIPPVSTSTLEANIGSVVPAPDAERTSSDTATSTIENSSSSTSTFQISSSTSTVTSSVEAPSSTATVDTSTSTAPSPVASSTVATSTDVATSSSSTVPPSNATSDTSPPPPQALPVDTSTSPVASSTSWLINLFHTAYAEEVSSTATATATSTDQNVASGTPTTPSSPPAGAMTIDTSMFQNIVIPSSTADDIISIVYSTDGTNWLPVVNINKDNWQVHRYALPIHSWAELEHLQIAFVGLGTAQAPRIYLDSVGVEANYVDASETPPSVMPAPSSSEVSSPVPASPDVSGGTLPANSLPPADQLIQQSDISLTDVYDQGAHQQCVVSPFSQVVTAGTSINFALELFSGLTTSSTPKTAPTSTPLSAYQHAMYQTRMGSLPIGVSATIGQGQSPLADASSTKTIHINTTGNAAKGSYSLLIVYRERQDDASLRSTACQLNLVIH